MKIVEGMSFVFPISAAHRIIDEVDKVNPEGAMTLMITAPRSATHLLKYMLLLAHFPSIVLKSTVIFGRIVKV